MSRIRLIIFFLLLGAAAPAQKTDLKIRYDDSVCVRALRLKKAYSDIKFQVSTPLYKQAYFDVFPGNFNELFQFFGYQEHPARYGILYYDYVNLIPEFFNDFFYYNDTDFYEKMMVVAMGGKWYSEGINMYQQQLRKEIQNNVELSCYVLDKMADDDVMDFWRFYFDGPKQDITVYEPLRNIHQINTRVYNLMTLVNPELNTADSVSH